MFSRLATLLIVSSLLFSHPQLHAQQPAPVNPAVDTPQAAVPAPDRIQQMRTDLNQMESLMNNMTSEITFLRDQSKAVE